MNEVNGMTLPACPKCNENYTYEDGHTFVCPMCFHEWTQQSMDEAYEASLVMDSNGNILSDGDEAVIAKDLKLGNSKIKQGAKVTGLRLLDDPVDGQRLRRRGRQESIRSGQSRLHSSVCAFDLQHCPNCSDRLDTNSLDDRPSHLGICCWQSRQRL